MRRRPNPYPCRWPEFSTPIEAEIAMRTRDAEQYRRVPMEVYRCVEGHWHYQEVQ